MIKMKHLFFVTLFLAFGTLSLARPAGAEAPALRGEQLRTAFLGRTVQISTPMGVLAVLYRPDGTMQGTASQAQASLFVDSSGLRDSGRWQVQGDHLCHRWRDWLSGQTFCVSITRAGDNAFHWRSPEGYSGAARIVR